MIDQAYIIAFLDKRFPGRGKKYWKRISENNDEQIYNIIGDMVCHPNSINEILDNTFDNKKDLREIRKREIIQNAEKPKAIKGIYVCTKRCKNDEFYTWALQTRSIDEPMTQFRQCTKCDKIFKE